MKRSEIKIVTFDWLMNSLDRGRRLKEKKFEWSKIDKKSLRKDRLKRALDDRQSGSEDSSTPGLTSVVQEHLEGLAGPLGNATKTQQKRRKTNAKHVKQAQSEFARGVAAAKADLNSGSYSHA